MSSDEIFGCGAVIIICFNGRNAALVDARNVLDALLPKSDRDAVLVVPS